MRTPAAFLFLLPLAAAPADDPREIVRRAVELDRRNAQLFKSYNFIERTDQRQYSGDGKPKKVDIRTFDVTLQEGSPYRRVIARHDQPLAPDEERAEQQKFEYNIEQRRHETPEQRARRIAAFERRIEKQREPAREIPDAFLFKLVGEEKLDGRAVWVVEATPKPGYKPRSSAARFFPKVRGKLWIDRASYQWVKGEMESLDTITLGAFLLRLAKGSRIAVEQTLVDGEVWLPRHVDLHASARILLFKSLRASADITYSNYRK
jgi:hypothetical protein